jgi:N-methylhydantoinase A
MSETSAIVGIDTGGTYTDFVLLSAGTVSIHKEPSTPDNPARAILAGLRHILGKTDGTVVIHGSTVATNALLERRGARALLITTAGFEDVLEIGRQTRRAIYDIDVTKTAPLVPAADRIGIGERIGPHGEVIRPLDEDSLRSVLATVAERQPESVAICLLHSYANHAHEARIADRLRDAHSSMFVTASHEVLPEFREYERCSTTVIDAYVGPVMSRYLGALAGELAGSRISIMQSNGGIMSLESARRHAVHTVLSGPAGGAVAGFETGKRAGYGKVISFDMGGTSTDVSLAAGALALTSEGTIGDLPVRVPVLDIHTVGAGGGSVAFVDPGGSLRVGPRSAGAEPGPICYGRGGEEITVSDANLFLGRLSDEHFLGGTQRLLVEPVNEAMERLARQLRLSAMETAEGVVKVANATMERAMRVISLERGHDPRDFTLICFGGAGGAHAADLAAGLGVPRVIVPPGAGTLSALGMLLAERARDYSRTLLLRHEESSKGVINGAFSEMELVARREFSAENVEAGALLFERSLDMRYVGQGYELNVADVGSARAEFNRLHEQRYGYADAGREVEVVNVRLRAVARSVKPEFVELERGGEDSSGARAGECGMIFGGMRYVAPVMDRDRLLAGNVVLGPALLVEYSTTTTVPPGWRAEVDVAGNLKLTVGS